ncbi:MAG: hypothetical protein ACRC5M_05620, partial [Anaeroplasmataceae bacterium]
MKILTCNNLNNYNLVSLREKCKLFPLSIQNKFSKINDDEYLKRSILGYLLLVKLLKKYRIYNPTFIFKNNKPYL